MRRTCLLLIITCLALPQTMLGFDTSTRVVGPVRDWNASDLERFDPTWIHLKFVEGSNVLFQEGRFVDNSGLDLALVNATVAEGAVQEVRRTFNQDRGTLRAWKRIGEMRSGETGPDLSLWYDLQITGGRPVLAQLLDKLNALPQVEIAHPAPIAEPAVFQEPVEQAPAGTRDDAPTPDYTGLQDYLYDTPVGLDAPAVWIVPGGTGAGRKFIDVELCWTEDHEDFNFANNFYIGGATQDPNYETHGTAVLGEVIGQPNGYGITGFAPDVQYGVVAVTVSEWPEVPHYFQEAVDHLDTGDVWLIELQMYPPGKNATPMEWLQVNYDVIWTSSWSLGIVCVEAGANGSQDLDDPSWEGVFDREIRDSGAIMVGAGTPTGRVAEYFTNYGTRMDVHAWGSQIVTTGYGDLYNGGSLQTRYTAQFGGTSGASPMITGSALCLQGVAATNLGSVLTPLQLRTILHDTGIEHLDPNKEIGPRPDLGAAAGAVLAINAIPDPAMAAGSPLVGVPNPFHETTQLVFSMPNEGRTRVSIYNIEGRRVRLLLDRALGAGSQQLTWDGRDDAGRDLGSGVYFYRLKADDLQRTGRLERIR